MASAGKRARHAVEAAAFRVLVGLVRRLPRRNALALGTALSRLAFDLFRVRRAVAVRQVEERVAPAGGRPEAVRIARASYGTVARSFVDLCRSDLEVGERIFDIVRREEFAEFERVFRLGRGAVFLSGHIGSWELLICASCSLGVPLGAMVKDQSNAAVNEWVRGVRARAGLTPISARHGVRQALKLLRSGGYVATLADQDAGRQGMFIDFLGKPASTPSGAVTMAVRAGAPVLPSALIDLGGGKYRAVFAPAWFPPSDRSPEEAVREGLEYYTRFLEDLVRAHPDNYFWAHRRWKTQPPADQQLP